MCCTAHAGCNETSKTKFVPTHFGLTDKEPRLPLGIDFEGPVDHATLSHCWGQLSFTTLTEGIPGSFPERIPPDCLTKAFRDVIDTVSYLGFKYLWIESLCIVQDDQKDWEREWSQMASVYGCSSINIAATGAVDGSIGLFFDRKETLKCCVATKSKRGNVIKCLPVYSVGFR
jgi:hypothetical protein